MFCCAGISGEAGLAGMIAGTVTVLAIEFGPGAFGSYTYLHCIATPAIAVSSLPPKKS
jgi:hypothetical protein